jgi:hypothetical protein
LGGGVGHRLNIAAVAFGCRGGRRRCDDRDGIDVGVNIIKAEGLLLHH